MKLERIYQSKGPARKATLLKQLILNKTAEGEDVKEHLSKFFDAVDKLSEMDVNVNDDLLAILLLYSLPPSYENFRCAIESRDTLPKPEDLRIKIVEENDSRRSNDVTANPRAFRAKEFHFKKKFFKSKGGAEKHNVQMQQMWSGRSHETGL